ncbi:MAG: YicC/YloC family endoribonuclease [Gammaproteobacteria bacterium]
MTAFSRASGEFSGTALSWELRSVNHRYLDIQVRLPEELRGLEPLARESMTARLGRGKLECQLRYHASDTVSQGFQVDRARLQALLQAYRDIEQVVSEPGTPAIMDLMRWPGVIEENVIVLQEIKAPALTLLDEAIDEFIASREREGARIADMLEKRCVAILEQVTISRQLIPDVQSKIRSKLLSRLDELDVPADSNRLEQELVFLAQKTDVDEELDRLEAHISEVRDVLKRKEPVGRRLDFLMQELNREANTLGSKSADARTTAAAVELKVLIEQMREQVQNIE